ncbi:MAG: snapalysin [Mycobacterium sp.]|jgi:hypothetical protein|nr:snapalysin [Mycobacterium sp.]
MNNPQPWWLTWPVAEVAAAILPLFSSSSHMEEHEAMTRIVSWFRTGSPTRAPFPTRLGAVFPEFDEPDYRAVAEAMQVRKHALANASFGRFDGANPHGRINQAGVASAPNQHRASASRTRRHPATN